MNATAQGTTMRAVVHDRYGDSSVLRVDQVPVPTPKAGEVLLRVHAASVNPADVITAAGSPAVVRMGTGLTRPKKRVRGLDVAGTVEAVGPDASRWQVGDAVFGEGVGTFAEFVRVLEASLALMSTWLSMEAASSIPLVELTCWQGLVENSNLMKGQKVLLHSGYGGVGTFAILLC